MIKNKIRFKDLNFLLKIAIIGGILALCEETIYFIKGFLGAL